MTQALNRREFAGALTGIVVAFSTSPRRAIAAEGRRFPAMLTANPHLDAWLRIEPSGTISIFTGRVELGQGNTTALAQIAAEELDVDMVRIRMIPVDTTRSPNEGATAGSNSIEAGGAALRGAAAQARAILIGRAAQRLNAPVADFVVDDGTILSRTGAGKLSYWELAETPFATEVTNPPAPKPASAHRIVGHDVQRLDIPAKAMGMAAFIQDLQLPGMLHGRVVRPPSYDAELISLDDSGVRRMPGVRTVARDGRFLGVVALREEQAIAARDALAKAAQWRVPESLPEMSAVHEFLQQRPDIDIKTVSAKTASSVVQAEKTISATYRKPYVAHASIGPSCAVAGLVDGMLTVWSHTQGPYPLRADLAKVLNILPEKVRVIHAQGSGCYGHNGADDVALDAALLSLATDGQIVRVQWMRDDEFAWEPFGSAMTMSVSAGMSADGSIVDWRYDVWSCTHNMRPGGRAGVNLLAAWHLARPMQRGLPQELALPGGGGDRNAVPTYNFANTKIVDHFIPDMPLRVSALRTLGGFGNIFALESMMDEAAAAAGADPLAFRLKHLDDARARDVLNAAAEKAGWTADAKSDGTRGRGLAFCRYETTKSYVAVIADVVVERASGIVRVERVAAAADAGQIVNPDGLKNQIEGGIIQGASWTLKEQVKFDRRQIASRDWAGYPIFTFDEVPEVEIVLLDRPELPSLGAGEASQGPISAAIANAIFHATGVRLRDLPFTPAKVKSALGQT